MKHPDWSTVHPEGIAGVSDIAKAENVSRMAMHRALFGRLGSPSAPETAAKWAPAIIGRTDAGPVFDLATYRRIKEGE